MLLKTCKKCLDDRDKRYKPCIEKQKFISEEKGYLFPCGEMERAREVWWSEPCKGKDQCHRESAGVKSVINSFIQSGNDVIPADDLFTADGEVFLSRSPSSKFFNLWHKRKMVSSTDFWCVPSNRRRCAKRTSTTSRNWLMKVFWKTSYVRSLKVNIAKWSSPNSYFTNPKTVWFPCLQQLLRSWVTSFLAGSRCNEASLCLSTIVS